MIIASFVTIISEDGLKRDKPGPKFPIRRCANNGFGPIP
jgi:hypothetical protein